MSTEYLLLEDVANLGRSGDVVTVKAGFARNFLIPKKKATVLDAQKARLQTRLREERVKRAATDLKEAEALASHLDGIVLTTFAKVDPDGHMYGSVAATDIVKLLAESSAEIEKGNVALKHPIKKIGVHDIELKLKEGVSVFLKLQIIPEGGTAASLTADAQASEDAEVEVEVSQEETSAE